MKKLPILLIGLIIAITGFSNVEAAGLNSVGISPSQISIQNLKPGLVVERRIVISRSESTGSEIYIINTDNSEASSWLTFLPGKQITIRDGESRAEIFVKITVPSDAEYKRYTPTLRIIRQQASSETGVDIQTGVLLSMNLLVSNLDVVSLKVISGKIDDVIIGSNPVLALSIENEGNVPAAPSKVKLFVTDSRGVVVTSLQTTELLTVSPLSTETQDITFIGYDFELGEYLADLTVYGTDEEEIYTSVLSFRVIPVPPVTPTDSSGNFLESYGAVGIILFGLIIIGFAIYKLVKNRRNQERF